MDRIDFLLSIFFTIVGFLAIRNFPLFLFGTFIPCVKATSYTLKLITNAYKEKITIISLVVIIGAGLLSIPAIKYNIESMGFGFGVIDNAKYATDFFKHNNLKGPIYNNFDIGNYLDYQLYPEEKVYVDNRPEAYPEEFFQKVYFPMQKSPSLFEQEDKKYNFNVIFYAHTDPTSGTKQLLQRIVNSEEWKMVYYNSIVSIFLKNTPANQQLIKKYAINQNNVKLSAADLRNKQKVIQLLNFFGAIGWNDQQLEMMITYLEHDPNNCTVIKTVAYNLQQKKDPRATIYVGKYLSLCH